MNRFGDKSESAAAIEGDSWDVDDLRTIANARGESAAHEESSESLLQQRNGVVRRPPPAKFAAIDVGTNSIHLLMAEISPEGDFHVLGRDKDMVQLGKGGFTEHILTEEAMLKGLTAIGRFAKMARVMGVEKIKAVATSAVREAHNGGDFVARVEDEVGLHLHVITQEEEARLIYLGVRHAIDLGSTPSLIVDIGGGSVEIIVGTSESPQVIASVKLGGSRLAELFLKSDPPNQAERRTLRDHIQQKLRPILARIKPFTISRCIGTSGSIRSLATLCAHRRGQPENPDGQTRFTRSELKSLIADMRGLTRAQRLKLPGVDPNRVDAYMPAAMVLLTLMRTARATEIGCCDFALREGVIVDHIGRHRDNLVARATWPDPRIRSVMDLADRSRYHKRHAEQVATLALSLFDQLKPLHQLDQAYRELLRYAAILHDIGYMISHRGHHKHSYYLVRNGQLQGFTDQEIEIIANTARYHRKERPKKTHYSYQHLEKNHREAVRRMSAILRIANALDRTHYSVVESVSCQILDDRVKLTAYTVKDAELELWTTRKQSEYFEGEFNRPLEIEAVMMQSGEKIG